MSSKSNYKSGKGSGNFVGARIHGIEAHPNKSWTIDGKSIPKPVLIRRLKNLVKRQKKVDDLAHDWREAIDERDAALDGEKKLLHDLDPGIRAGVGNSAKALAPFGMEPLKDRAPLSPEDRLVAKARAKATREGLGTRGKRQRQAKLDELRGKPQVKVIDPNASNPPATPPAPPQTTAAPVSSGPAAAPVASTISGKNTVVPPADGASPLDGAASEGGHA